MIDLDIGMTIKASRGREEKFLMMGYPLSFLQEGVHSNKKTNFFDIVGSDEDQRTSAKYMHGSLVLRLGICFVSFMVGSLADYQQNYGLYFVFTVLNACLGFLIFFFHSSCNETVSKI